jgi:prepilin-type N-terminal cleavage/methylation domain-containing protein
MRPARDRSSRGFTLLECMVAMAILATVLVVLLENHAASLRLSETSRKYSVAINLARSVMNDLEVQVWPDIGSDQGNFEDTYPGLFPDFRWENDVEENVFWPYVRECRVRVLWYDGPVERNVEILEYLAAVTQEQQQEAEAIDDDASDDDNAGSGGSGSAKSKAGTGGS